MFLRWFNSEQGSKTLGACPLWGIRTERPVSPLPHMFLARVSPEITPSHTRIILRQVCWVPRTQQGPISLFCLEKMPVLTSGTREVDIWLLFFVVVFCSLKLPWSLQIPHSPVRDLSMMGGASQTSPQRVSLLTVPEAAACVLGAWVKLVCELCTHRYRWACPGGVAKASLSRGFASEGALYGNDSFNCILSKPGWIRRSKGNNDFFFSNTYLNNNLKHTGASFILTR